MIETITLPENMQDASGLGQCSDCLAPLQVSTEFLPDAGRVETSVSCSACGKKVPNHPVLNQPAAPMPQIREPKYEDFEGGLQERVGRMEKKLAAFEGLEAQIGALKGRVAALEQIKRK